MNEISLINQVRSRILPYISQIAEEASFFQLPYLEHDSMITNLVRLNLACWLAANNLLTRSLATFYIYKR